jgi:hypothetical protein
MRKLPKQMLSSWVPDLDDNPDNLGDPDSETLTPDGLDPETADTAEDSPPENADAAENSPPENGEDATQTEPAEPAEEGQPAEDPEGAVREPGEILAGDAVDKFFARHSRHVNPNYAKNLARTLLERIDPDRHDGFDPDAVERRSVNHSTDANGMVVGRFQLDPVSGAWFRTAIEHFSAPNPTVEEEADDGASVTIRDNRKAAQRRADALGLLSRLALGSEDAGTAKGGEPPRIVVHAGVQDILDALHTTTDHTPPEYQTAPQPENAAKPKRKPQPEPATMPEPQPEPATEPESASGHPAESARSCFISRGARC